MEIHAKRLQDSETRRHNVDINADSDSLSFVPPRTTDLQRRSLAVTVMTYSPRLKHWYLPANTGYQPPDLHT
jgi:hypothetical protein